MNKLKKWFKRLVLTSLVLFCLFVVLDFFIPLPIEDFKQRHFAQVVVDKDGQPLRAFPDKQGVWRYPIAMNQVSPLYLQALINYEDRYFYQHFGVNPLAMVRALGQLIKNGKIISGASTLTMQVARILKPHKKSFSGKLVQMFMALQLEWHYNKQEILNYYINYAPFGGTIQGVEAASFAYFDKTSLELTASEAALLAVMPQSPSRFRPDRYPQRAKKARNKLLDRLAEFEIWDKQTIKEAKQEEIWAQYNTHPMIAPLLTRRLIKGHPNQSLIKSTIDIALQTDLELLVKQYSASMPEKTSVALLVIDNESASALAYIGSADFFNNERTGHVDMLQAIRSPGSTLKPFIYGLAIDQGLIHSESLLFDVPQSYAGYRPKNFTNHFNGPISVSQALGRSLNMPAVQVLNELSPELFYARLKNAGLSMHLPLNAKPNLSIALGGGGVKLEELVGLFSGLGRDGKAVKVRFSQSDKFKEFTLLTKGSAWIVQNILAKVSLNSIHSKTVINNLKIAYKTGTSYGNRDAWVMASNSEITIGIWVGRPDGAFIEKNSGRGSAVPLLKKVLAMMPEQMLELPKKPFNVSLEKICWPLGKKLSMQNTEYCHKQRSAYLIDDVAPPTLSDELKLGYSTELLEVTMDSKTGQRVLPSCYPKHIITKKIALWPQVLEPWLSFINRRMNLLPKYSSNCQEYVSLTKIEISGVHNHATLYPSAGSNSLPIVELKVNGDGQQELYWFVNGGLQESTVNELDLRDLKQGSYHVMVVDEGGGFAEIEFSVGK
jgi:penicillin-binding protein 1C